MYNGVGPYVSNPVKHYVNDMWCLESTVKTVERIWCISCRPKINLCTELPNAIYYLSKKLIAYKN